MPASHERPHLPASSRFGIDSSLEVQIPAVLQQGLSRVPAGHPTLRRFQGSVHAVAWRCGSTTTLLRNTRATRRHRGTQVLLLRYSVHCTAPAATGLDSEPHSTLSSIPRPRSEHDSGTARKATDRHTDSRTTLTPQVILHPRSSPSFFSFPPLLAPLPLLPCNYHNNPPKPWANFVYPSTPAFLALARLAAPARLVNPREESAHRIATKQQPLCSSKPSAVRHNISVRQQIITCWQRATLRHTVQLHGLQD